MAPEYLQRGIITTKSDIFSLGVIIIEIMTGHKNYPFGTGTSCHEFVELVSGCVSTLTIEIVLES
jgi:serine/threonine protein kinase